ncbi:MAG: class I SAM-dependent methyltransferase [Anaerolineales bacterium]|nr:class I SAM-dependent methyltransferase [Anaerolineales bacterium]
MEDHARLNPPPRLAAIAQATVAAGFSMPSEPLAGSLLRTLAATKPGGYLLELGTGTGLATAWLLDGMDAAARLLSVDNDPAVQAIAQAHLGDHPRLRLVCQDGDDFLRAAAAQPQRYDLVFADTWPGKYRLLDEALALLAPGGLYLIDDMLPQANWPADHPPKVAALIATLEARRDLHVTKLGWASGLILVARAGR